MKIINSLILITWFVSGNRLVELDNLRMSLKVEFKGQVCL